MGNASRHAIWLLALLSLLAGLSPARAQDLVRSISAEYARVVDRGNAVTTLGDDVFGDRTSLHDGTTEFRIVDVDLPGNDALPVEFARRFAVEETQLQSFDRGKLGDWEIDVPHLSGLFTRQYGWQVEGDKPQSRCSRQAGPRVAGGFSAAQFWYGVRMHVPGEADQELLVPTASSPAGPTSGGPYSWLTRGHWYFACLPALRNGEGEGFLAISPDGIRYTFDWMVARDAASVTRPSLPNCMHTAWVNPFTRGVGEYESAVTSPDFLGTGVSDGIQSLPCTDFLLKRSEVRLYATRIEDRFGNRVDYEWVGDRLVAITASDDRAIAISYGANGFVAEVATGASRWRYAYTDHQLASVTLPDGARWTYASNSPVGIGAFLVIEHDYDAPPLETNEVCLWPGYGGREFVYTVTHPAGAVGEFRFAPNRIPRTYAPKECLITTGTPGYFFHPPFADVYSIFSKTVSGPAIPARRWTYAYDGNGGNMFSFQAFCTSNPGALHCKPYNTTSVTGPTGVVTRHQFGNKFADTEGQLQAVRVYSATGTLLSETTQAYASASDGVAYAFPLQVGNSLQARGSHAQETSAPRTRTVRSLDGVQYSNQVLEFDAYVHPVRVLRQSALGSAEDRYTYAHDLSVWVLGQAKTASTNGIEHTRTDYVAATALPSAQYAFGALQATFGHNANGTLAWMRDGRGNQTTLSAHRRGLAQSMAFADGTSVSAVVNNLGAIDSRKDQLGSQWTYTRDLLGRLRTITYPAGDTVAWAPTTFAFTPVNATEYGLPPGHWRRTEQTGTGRTTTYYDGQWRPVVTQVEDTAIAGTRSVVLRRYDALGRESFTSYPLASLASINDSVPGTRTTYDDLGRVVRVEQDSELGVLATTTQYLAGGAVRVTDAKNRATTTRYQAFDAPDNSLPVAIDLPLGIEVRIDRDVFGKPLAITRRGPHDDTILSATRRFVYDANQRLCKAINPESGAQVNAYDAAGNVAWIVQGSTLTGTTMCDRDSVPSNARTAHTYDPLNRLKTVSTPDGNGNLTYGYAPDGAILSVAATNPANAVVNTTYGYNKRRLLTSETSAQPNWYSWVVGYAYDANGHPATLTYPSGLTLAYAPNALGQATKVGAFAGGISYHPNGAVRQYTYGNGIVRTVAYNLRGMPSRQRDAFAGESFVDDSYDYDEVGNVTDITDQAQEGTTTRGMSYDDLDRLTVTVASRSWGDATFEYDPLDNIRISQLGLAGYSYNYDVSNRLVGIVRSGGGAYPYTTDARGNVTSDGRRTFSFDQRNRLSAVVGKESYRYDGAGRRALSSRGGTLTIHMYDRGGRVLQSHDTRRGQRLNNIYLGRNVIAQLAVPLSGGATVTSYVHSDTLGSVVAKTTPSRGVAERTSYTPYGLAMERAADGIGFTAHVSDADTGLVYAQQRYYDPEIGRFLGVDPIATNTGTGAGFGRYAYAANNPYRFIDPDGRQIGKSWQDRFANERIRSWFRTPVSFADEVAESGGQPPPVEQGSRANTRVYAKEGGTVIVVGWQNPNRHHGQGAGAGYRVKIDVGDGKVRLYGHMDPESVAVGDGDQVQERQYIGNYANPTNGHSTGPHVHDQLMQFENGRRTDIDPGARSPLGSTGGRVTTPFGVRDASHPNNHQGTDWVYEQDQ